LSLLIVALGLPFGVAQDQAKQLREEPVWALIKAFADARNAHDGQAVAAVYSEDGEWITDPSPVAHSVSGPWPCHIVGSCRGEGRSNDFID
jgi:hypothetical protein